MMFQRSKITVDMDKMPDVDDKMYQEDASFDNNETIQLNNDEG